MSADCPQRPALFAIIPGAARLLWTQKQDIGVILAVEFRARLRLGSKADLPVRGERGLHGHVVVGRQVLEAVLVIRPDEANWTLDDFRHGPQLHRAVRWRTRCGTGASRHLGVRRHVVDAGRRHRSVTANRTRHRVRPEPWRAGAVRRAASWATVPTVNGPATPGSGTGHVDTSRGRRWGEAPLALLGVRQRQKADVVVGPQ